MNMGGKFGREFARQGRSRRSLQKNNGALTSNAEEMHGVFLSQWLPAVFLRYSHPESPLRDDQGHIHRPSWPPFRKQIRDYIARNEFDLKETTAQKLSNGTYGLDSWTVAEIKQLPEWVWTPFADA